MFANSQPGATTTPGAPAWAVGEHTVRRIDEIPLPPQTGTWLLPGATPDMVTRTPWLRPDYADEQGILRLASHSFAIEADGMRILVDTGIGNGKRRTNPAWHNLNSDYDPRLRAAGFAPETVDLVILTHLHTDHVGWNTRAEGGNWVPTFPNARYLTTRTEWDHWAASRWRRHGSRCSGTRYTPSGTRASWTSLMSRPKARVSRRAYASSPPRAIRPGRWRSS